MDNDSEIYPGYFEDPKVEKIINRCLLDNYEKKRGNGLYAFSTLERIKCTPRKIRYMDTYPGRDKIPVGKIPGHKIYRNAIVKRKKKSDK